VRAGANAANPAAILVPAILATACSTTVAIIAAKLLAKPSAHPASTPATDRLAGAGAGDATHPAAPAAIAELSPPGPIGRALVLLLVLAFAGAPVYRAFTGNGAPSGGMDLVMAATQWITPMLMVGFLVFGYFRGVRVYETLTDGAKEGVNVAVRIIPFLVAIFVAIGMFRASGALELLTRALEPATSLIGMPAEALPMALIRPLSGTGAFGIMSEVVSREPDGLTSFIVSIMQGSTETTFYVLAVYFGAIGIKRTRHALPAALLADAAGVLAAVWLGNLFF
jgi:spore maturation protein SpmB